MINNQYYQNLISWSEDLRSIICIFNKFLSESNHGLNKEKIYEDIAILHAFLKTASTNQEHQYFIYQIQYWINEIPTEMRYNEIIPGWNFRNKDLCLHYEMISDYIIDFQQKLKQEIAYETNAFEALESLSVMFEVK